MLGERPSLLIIEDNPAWRDLFKDLSIEAGFQFDFAEKAESARLKIARPQLPYRVVVLDACLGDDLEHISSRLIVEDIAASELDPNIILVSGVYSIDELARRFRTEGGPIEHTFEKANFDIERFRDVLRGIADQSPPQAYFRPDVAALRQLHINMHNAATRKEKGQTLELFAKELLSSIPALEYQDCNVHTATGEVDITFFVRNIPGSAFQDWGSLLLVECKNWTQRINKKEVSDFQVKLLNSGARVGILFSRSGITGKDGKAAAGQIRNAFLSSGRVIIVIEQSDIDAVVHGQGNLYEILLKKYLAVHLEP